MATECIARAADGPGGRMGSPDWLFVAAAGYRNQVLPQGIQKLAKVRSYCL